MTNTTLDYWDVNGTSLQTYRWNIATWGEDRQSPPTMRGSNIQLPYTPGTKYVSKIPDGRTMNLPMWVAGCDANGNTPADSVGEFRDNYEELRSLLWNNGNAVFLTKRWNDGANSAWTVAEYIGGLEPRMTGAARATMVPRFYLPYPFFLGPSTAASGASPTILGDYTSRNVTITMTGGTNPRYTNNTTGVWIQYNGSVGGTPVVIDCYNFRATQGGTVVSGKISHSGSPNWMLMNPGVQSISTSGGGSIAATYLPTYF